METGMSLIEITDHRGNPLESHRRRTVSFGMGRVPQFARPGADANPAHPDRGIARRILHFALRVSRARSISPGPVGAPRVSGDDIDHPDLLLRD